MQTEAQEQALTCAENALLGESVQSKSKRGGKRPGAGRYDEAYRDVVREFCSDVPQDAPQNQTESSTTIEVEVVEPEG